MNLNEARDILGKCGYSFLKESTELTRDIMLKYAKQLAQQNDKIGITKGKYPEDGDFDIIIYYNNNKIKVASYIGDKNKVYVREFKSSLSGMPAKKVETLEDLRSYIDSTLKYMEKYKEDNNNQYKTSVEDIEKDKEEWANNMDQNESLKIKKALQFLAECGYTISKNKRIDEMSRASDRTLGATSNANLLYKLADWKKGYDRSGKSPTLGALRKFLDDNGFTWDQVKNVDFDLPDNAPATTARKTFDLAQLVRCLASENELDLDTVRNNVEQGKDEYDKLIDTFWDYYEKVHDGSDVSEFVQTPEFKAVVDLFKDDPEKAQEVFGRNYEKAAGYLAKFLDADYENTPKGLISAFWDWYRAKKAGQDIDFPEEKAEALARVLEGVNPQQYFSNSGLYFFVNRTVGNMVGRRLEPADEDFDYGSFDNDFTV